MEIMSYADLHFPYPKRSIGAVHRKPSVSSGSAMARLVIIGKYRRFGGRCLIDNDSHIGCVLDIGRDHVRGIAKAVDKNFLDWR